jgi:hypothetical protein
MFTNKIYKSDKITVDSKCSKTYPCQHYVTINNKTILMSATEIYKLIKEETNLIPNHFDYIV